MNAKEIKKMKQEIDLLTKGRKFSEECGVVEAHVGREAVWVCGELKTKAKGIAQDMDRLFCKLKTHGIWATVNPLGELQMQASELDQLCTRLTILRDLYKMFPKGQEEGDSRVVTKRRRLRK